MRTTLVVLTLFLSLTAMGAMSVVAPVRSPMLNEIGDAQLIDESSRHVPIYGVIFPDSNGATSLNSHYVAGQYSQVTGRQEPSRYRLASGAEIPLIALSTIDQSTHALKPLALPASLLTLAGDVTGPASASVVSLVGGASAASVASAASYVTAAKAIVAVADKPSGGSVGSAASTVDVAFVLNATQTTAAQTLTLPSPTVSSAAKLLYVVNSGSASFTLLGATVAAGAAKGALWNGSSWIAL